MVLGLCTSSAAQRKKGKKTRMTAIKSSKSQDIVGKDLELKSRALCSYALVNEI